VNSLSLEVGFPLALVGLALVPVFVLFAFRSRYLLSPRRRVLATVLRVLVVVLVVSAMADVRLGLPTDDLAVGVVVDRSASIADAEREKLDHDLAELRETAPDVDFMRADHAGDDPLASTLERDLLAADSALARDRVDASSSRPMGATSAKTSSPRFARLRTRGARVDILPLGASPPIDAVAVSSVEVPRLVRAGETLDVEVELHAGRAQRVTLRATVDGEEKATAEVDLPEGLGRHRLAVTFPEDEGAHVLSVAASASGDVMPENDPRRRARPRALAPAGAPPPRARRDARARSGLR
jgi:hypothetical protein